MILHPSMVLLDSTNGKMGTPEHAHREGQKTTVRVALLSPLDWLNLARGREPSSRECVAEAVQFCRSLPVTRGVKKTARGCERIVSQSSIPSPPCSKPPPCSLLRLRPSRPPRRYPRPLRVEKHLVFWKQPVQNEATRERENNTGNYIETEPAPRLPRLPRSRVLRLAAGEAGKQRNRDKAPSSARRANELRSGRLLTPEYADKRLQGASATTQRSTTQNTHGQKHSRRLATRRAAPLGTRLCVARAWQKQKHTGKGGLHP